jgi:hypothetical protein
VFVDSESVHRMNGTVAPFRAILGTMIEVVPYGQRTLVVARAHTMDLYGPGECGNRDGYLLGRAACHGSPVGTHSLVAPGGASPFTC